MYIYTEILYYLSFLSIYLPIITTVSNTNLKVANSGLERVNPCSVGLIFFADLNNTAIDDFLVEILPDECCLELDEDLDCNSIRILGNCNEYVPGNTVKRMTFVAPTLNPIGRKGYCTVHIDSHPNINRRELMRDTLTLQFNTKKPVPKYTFIEENIKLCDTVDKDPFNNCEPVDCDSYYNGFKSYYDMKKKRCVETQMCLLGSKLYDPIRNECFDDSVTKSDINFVRSLSENERKPKEVIIITHHDSFETTDIPILSTLGLQDKMISTVTPFNITESRNDYLFLRKPCFNGKYSLGFLILVILVQCLLIVTLYTCLSGHWKYCSRKKLVRKFFNYRNDASVTTPLIATSNIDTETTPFDYASESSNIENKIRCYKACQKENDAKISMTDDILTKCLNRRDWQLKSKSETGQDVKLDIKNNDYQVVKEEKPVQKPANNEEVIRHKSFENNQVTVDFDSDSTTHSERILLCHDYHMKEVKNNYNKAKSCKKTISLTNSTEKGAQASFSNDSLDDFLSERGMEIIGNMSKISFESESSRPRSSSTDVSSKTSKNNVLKNFLTYLSKKSKVTVTSEPGGKKNKDHDLKLLHMSRASMFSDSDSGFRKMKSLKFAKDSRSTY